MHIGRKILLGAAIAVFITILGAIATEYAISRGNRVNELRKLMSSTIQQSETVRNQMDQLHLNKAFNLDQLIKEEIAKHGGRPIKEYFQETPLFKTIPVVSAWLSVVDVAKSANLRFYTPTHPRIPARNPKNANSADFAAAFTAFDQGQEEYFFEDREKSELLLARPMKLSSTCLTCHGRAEGSSEPNDPLGFPRETMKVGDIKGAFVLVAPMTRDAVVFASIQYISTVGVFILIIVLLGFWFLNEKTIISPLSSIISRVDEASLKTAHAATELSSASRSLSEGASQQAAALEETSASIEEISGMTKNNAANAGNANTLSDQARQVADAGTGDVSKLSTAMQGIKNSSDSIAKIIKIIDEIAFQTNLLALNAAVEAARAGEAGKGFAVVADEVRNLAMRSAAAARETAQNIEDSIHKSEQGVEIGDQVGKRLQEIAGKTRDVDALISQISAASKEQSQGIEQLTKAIQEMEKVTQSNASVAEQSAASAAELDGQSRELKNAVAELVDLVGRSGGH